MTNIKNILKFLYEQNESQIEIYLDMDGVLADFDKAVSSNSEVQEAEQKMLNHLSTRTDLLSLYNEPGGKDKLKTFLKKYKEHKKETGKKDDYMEILNKLFSTLDSKKYKIASYPGYFENLELMPGAIEMVEQIISLTGKLPNILTAPISSNQNCQIEKKNWIDNHFSGKYNQFICTANKQEYAKNRKNILIDDRPKYVDPFRKNGGTAILHFDTNDTVKKLKDIIENFNK